MQFSLFFFGSPGSAEEEDPYGLLLDAARFGDREGFAAVWTPERHFAPFGGLFPSPAVIGAAVAAVTERIGVRAGSVTLPLHDPIRVAEEWSVLDNLSGGRVGVSFASGWHDRDFVLAPECYAERRRILAERIAEVRKLWRGEAVRRVSGSGTELEVRIYPRPRQVDLPMWLTAAGTEETFRRAGELGTGVLTHLLGQDWPRLEQRIGIYREARREAGFDAAGGCVTLMVHACLGEPRERLRERIEPVLRGYLEDSFELIQDADSAWSFGAFGGGRAEHGGETGGAVHFRSLSDADRDRIVRRAARRYFDESGLFGSLEEGSAVVERARAAGVDELACLIDFGLPAAEVLRRLPALGELARCGRSEPGRGRVGSGGGRGEEGAGTEAAASVQPEVAQAWREILGKAPGGAGDDFFRCGGNSIQAVQLMARLNDSLQLDLSPTLVFECPTAGELGEAVVARRSDGDCGAVSG